jgi:phosphoglycerate dehydrogenase-like enzyme
LQPAPKILILDRQADDYRLRLSDAFSELDIVAAANPDALPAELSPFDVLIAFGLSISDALLRRMTSLRWIQALGAGVDYFQKSASLRPDVILTSARGIHGPPLREHVIFLMQSVSRQSARIVQAKERKTWDRVRWPLLHGKTALVLGTGIAGAAIAGALKSLGMTVIGATRTIRPVAGFDRLVALSDLAGAAGQADYIINVLPGLPENKGLIGREIFAAMKQTAFFVNVGRGDSVDEAALVECLKQKEIAGAALDVFQEEPLSSDSPFWALENVFLTAHVGGYFNEYIDHVLPIIAENVVCYRQGRIEDMRNRVDAPAAVKA